ncbi:MAG: hypothetical protein J5864_10885, partial [Oscillospiraceae bacterium]|nr:hypothetical protein [Oscillospiraceae bacterium]
MCKNDIGREKARVYERDISCTAKVFNLFINFLKGRYDLMDKRRSDRIRKTAAIAALVLVVGTASVAAELGNSGVFNGDVVNAITINEKTDYEITNEASLKAFLTQDDKKRGIITQDFEVSKSMGVLKSGRTLYGAGKTITLTETNGTASPLFTEVENGAKLENVVIETKKATDKTAAAVIKSTGAVGAVCSVNNGELRYITVDAVVYSAANSDHDNAPAGIICGENNGTIFGCIADGILDTRNNYAGSVCGKNNETGIIERCPCRADIRFSRASNENLTKPSYCAEGGKNNCTGYDGNKYTGNYSSQYIGGFCGYTAGKIYDCIFEGYLPHYVWK